MKTMLFSNCLKAGCFVGISALAIQLCNAADPPGAGLTLQLEASAVTTSGGNVTTWADQSGSVSGSSPSGASFTLAPVTGATEPTAGNTTVGTTANAPV